MKENALKLLEDVRQEKESLVRWAAENLLVAPPIVLVAVDKEIARHVEREKNIQNVLDKLEEK